MKTLVENSISYLGFKGKTKLVNKYEVVEPQNRLINLSNRKMTFFFECEEEGVKTGDKVLLTVVKSKNEDEIRDFIIEEIKSKISKL